MTESTKKLSASLSYTIPRNCRNKSIKGKTKSNTKIEEYFIIPFTAMDKSPKCKISKEH